MCLQDLALVIGLLVLFPKRHITHQHQDDVHQRTGNASVHAGLVPRRLVLLPEDQAAGNAPDAAEADEGGGAEGALPLAADVVGLEAHHGGDVRVGAGGDEENAEVAHRGGGVPAHDGQADEGEHHVHDDAGPAEVVLVAEPAGEEHEDAGKGVRGGDETLRSADVEAHVLDQQDGERVGQGVGDGGGAEEDESVRPDLPVGTGAEELAEVELLVLGVAAVAGDAGDDPGSLRGAEEGPVLAGGIWEVDEEPVAGDSQGAGEDTFDGEDPAPAGQSLTAVELHELRVVSVDEKGVGDTQDVHRKQEYQRRQRRRSRVDRRASIAFRPRLGLSALFRACFTVVDISLTASVPRAEQVHAAGEETSLEHTEQHARASQLAKVLDEAHSDHDGTPEERDGGKMDTGSDGTDENGGRGLEEDVRDEENKVGNVLQQVSSCSFVRIKSIGTYVSVIDIQAKLRAHTRNIRCAHVGSVHETDAVHGANGDDKTTIDASHDAPLLVGREAMVVRVGVDVCCLLVGVDVRVLGERLLHVGAWTGLHGH